MARFEATVEEIVGGLHAGNHDLAVEFAELPQRIRGYGHVKERAAASVTARQAELAQAWQVAQSARAPTGPT